MQVSAGNKKAAPSQTSARHANGRIRIKRPHFTFQHDMDAVENMRALGKGFRHLSMWHKKDNSFNTYDHAL